MGKRVSSKHLENVSDLTLWAPIRQGFVPALEAVTYETRVRLVMNALFKVRATAREYSKFQPFVESAERIQSLLDFRIVILDADAAVVGEQSLPAGGARPKMLMLSVAFDRPFEPYMRLVWDPLGPLLDLFFCNTERYVVAGDSSFPAYLDWVRSVQIDTDFFYAASNHTIADVQYLSQMERLHRDALMPNLDVIAMSECAVDPVERAKAAQKRNVAETMDMGLQALVALGRLTDFYPPDDPQEGRFLKRAAAKLLQDWDPKELPAPVRHKYAEYLELLAPPPPRPRDEGRLRFDPAEVQTGIVGGYELDGKPMTHGCLMLMRIADAEKARAWLGTLKLSTEAAPFPDGGVSVNLAFTLAGLGALGVSEDTLAQLPQEFLEGMEARAGMIGDTGDSHPRRWALPRRCRADVGGSAPSADAAAPPVELKEVDFVLQLRTNSDYPGHDVVGDPLHPLAAKVAALAAGPDASGVELLAVESMRRAWLGDGSNRTVAKDHFGFLDGFSQPVAISDTSVPERDRVALGELLIGYGNDRGDPPQRANAHWDNGTFLVIRKLKQEVGELEAFLDRTVAELTRNGFPVYPQLRDDLLGKMMGRRPDGSPLLQGTSTLSNDFDYKSDLRGQQCPFQSHIRRANPRTDKKENFDRPVPRIMRRGMSYGPPRDAPLDGERGVMFMAYNASIAEQFEVVQSWISGGNSTRVASCQSDPLMGPARDQDPRTFVFRLQNRTIRLRMPNPYVKLQWGAYLFVPSASGLKAILAPRAAPAGSAAEEGEKIIAAIEAQDPEAQALAWKTCFEDVAARDPDDRNVGPRVWAAIRARGGAIKVPYGWPPKDEKGRLKEVVLVGSRDLIDEVLGDDERFSVDGYMPRMRDSIGEIYLGRDAGDEYWNESRIANGAIAMVTEEAAFASARKAGAGYLENFQRIYARNFPQPDRPVKIDLVHDYIAGVLALICRGTFGFPDQPPLVEPQPGHDILDGSWKWTPQGDRRPVCPGDFMAPSSFIFYVDPIAGFTRRGQADGTALREAARRHYEKRIAAGSAPQAPIANAIYQQFLGTENAADMIARTVIGVMMGFLPPADGCLRGTLYDWLSHGTLWRIQHDLLAVDAASRDHAAVQGVLRTPLIDAMRKRPAPDALWRTAKKATTLRGVAISEGDKVCLGIASATAEAQASDDHAIYPVFGGNRRATPHPTHACPAFPFAMGAMTGMLCALLEVGRIEALPAPLIVTIPRLPGT
ncbi:MAG TPA: hypothetical protein VF702_13630 [Allosphingosinicella sp.]|jgi:Dyp-type peroxidase family